MSQKATHSIKVDWKAFNINANMVQAWGKAHLGSAFCGISSDSALTFWFTSEPTPDEQAAIELYWESLTETSEEHTSYQTGAQKAASEAADKAAKVASATAKLLALGLSADEVKAILG